jgi:hypothetical protein
MSFHLQNNSPTTLAIRAAIGAIQGAGLYVLANMASNGKTEMLSAWLYVSLVMGLVVVPTILHAGLTTMRPLTLLSWIALLASAVVAISLHATWREPDADRVELLWLLAPLVAATFIGHNLIASADADERLLARYYAYFDTSWRNGIQLALCFAFVGAFWMLMFLGANLFELINITIISEIIEKAFFAYPATCIVFALAVQITSERIALVTGARTIALLLLGWLLPVLALFTVAFLGSLGLTGLSPLWATGHATPLLVLAGATLIVLINATYQDGSEEHRPAAILRLSARISALALAPITLIAFYSIWLRVQQYGLTPERTIGLAFVTLGACYATGYVLAAVWPGKWLRPVEVTNVAAAALCVGLILSLLTPVADPIRLSVDDQVARLHAGRTTLARFDFDFLRFDAGRYGREMLDRLATDKSSPAAIEIAAKAEEARQRKKRATGPGAPAPELTVEDLRSRIKVSPAGASLPDTFLTQDWTNAATSPRTCVRDAAPGFQCEAMLADIDRDNIPDILLRSSNFDITVFHQVANGPWLLLGHFRTVECGAGTAGNFATGEIRMAPARFNDLEVRGRTVQLDAECPPDPAPATPPAK